MNTPAVVARVREYRRLTAADVKTEALRLGLTAEEADSFSFTADSNAIWDAQEGRDYRKPVYTKRLQQPVVPMYDELGFLSDEEYKRIMGKERQK
jgi:hypothetical protein